MTSSPLQQAERAVRSSCLACLEAAMGALADAGLTPADVDGIAGA